MKLYTVWSGEYSDRGMHAIFKSKEKAEKYMEVHDKINGGYDDYYIIDYELEDDKFDINTKAVKYYYCSIALEDRPSWNDPNVLAERKGDILTDECWDSFMEHCGIEYYENLNPVKYYKHISEVLYEDPEDTEDEYSVTATWDVDGAETVINDRHGSIDVYSKRGYHHARKVAIEQYQIYTQKQLEEGTLG